MRSRNDSFEFTVCLVVHILIFRLVFVYVIIRVMFGNFAKIGRPAGVSPTWQNFQTSRELLI